MAMETSATGIVGFGGGAAPQDDATQGGSSQDLTPTRFQFGSDPYLSKSYTLAGVH